MDAELQGLPPLTQPPLYAPAYGTDDPLSPSSKSCPGYLKQLSLVPSFEPPIVYLMTETIPAQTALTGEVIGRGQPSTPRQFGTYNPMEPTFSDMLRRREARQLALGHPPLPTCQKFQERVCRVLPNLLDGPAIGLSHLRSRREAPQAGRGRGALLGPWDP